MRTNKRTQNKYTDKVFYQILDKVIKIYSMVASCTYIISNVQCTHWSWRHQRKKNIKRKFDDHIALFINSHAPVLNNAINSNTRCIRDNVNAASSKLRQTGSDTLVFQRNYSVELHNKKTLSILTVLSCSILYREDMQVDQGVTVPVLLPW